MSSVSSRFLKRVWSQQPTGGYAFFAWFDEEHEWDDAVLHIPTNDPKLKIPPLPNDSLDVYFAPCLFEKGKRQKVYALPGRWLYADLDEVDPKTLTDLMPTIAWETSKGRYQALWLLEKALRPKQLAALNQRVTYFTGADKGGWSLTKVLRVPGSISTKHGYNWSVKLLWDNGPTYLPRDVVTITKGTKTPNTTDTALKDVKIPKVTPSAILRRRKCSAKIRKLYKAKEARGDRSARLWELECLLLKAGCTPEETLVVVRKTVWNKYQGQRREVPQLWTEINKAASSLNLPKRRRSSKSSRKRSTSSSKSRRSERSAERRSRNTRKKSKSTKTSSKKSRRATDPDERHTLTSYNDFMSKPLKRPGWLVEGVWSENAHGLLAGEAKTYKSVIATDLAVSIASGTPFLNSFQIPVTGPVIMIQEENDPGEFQDRLRRIAHSRGLLGRATVRRGQLQISPDTELPLTLLNNRGFNLTDKDDLKWLRRKCRQLKPALIILDPFYLMTPGIDENSQHQVTPVLERLLKMKQRYGAGIQIIHHYKKQSSFAPIYGAARMSGTGVFHRWFESAVYVERNADENPFTVRLMPDHRGHAPQGAIKCTFDLGGDDDLEYGVMVSHAKADRAAQHLKLERFLDEKDDWTISELRVAMGFSSSEPLKQMLVHHGYGVEKVKTGQRGRPSLRVTKIKPKGDASRR